MPEKVFPQLDVLLKQAVKQSPRMLNQALELEIAENNRIQARSNLLPSIGGFYNYSQARDDRADLNGWVNVTKNYYSFSLNQPIFYWGERRNMSRIGEIQQKIAQGNLRDGYRLLAQEIRGSYLYLIIRKTNLERIRLNDKYQQGILKLAEERRVKNVISEAEIFPVRISAERARIETERAVFDYDTAKDSLARLTGARRIDDAVIADDIPDIPYTAAPFNQLLAGFLSQKEPVSNDAVNSRRQLEIENLNYLNAKTRLRPKFNFTIGTTQDEQSYTVNIAQKYQVNSQFVGISATWTIFDGFAAGAAKRNALIRVRQAETAYRDLTENLARQAQNQVKQIDFSARNMSIANRLLGSAQGALDTRQADFARGVASETDVSVSQLNHYDVRLTTMGSRIEYLLTVTGFLGTVSEDPVFANIEAKP